MVIFELEFTPSPAFKFEIRYVAPEIGLGEIDRNTCLTEVIPKTLEGEATTHALASASANAFET